MNRLQLIMLAVAMGETRAAAEARIDAAFPELAPPPAPKPADVVGHRVEVRGGVRRRFDIRADGTETEVPA